MKRVGYWIGCNWPDKKIKGETAVCSLFFLSPLATLESTILSLQSLPSPSDASL
jgi:hypothetical protein